MYFLCIYRTNLLKLKCEKEFIELEKIIAKTDFMLNIMSI